MRKAMSEREVVAIRGRLYSCGLPDVLSDIVRKALAADSLNDCDQQLKAGNGPIPLLPRLVNPVFSGIQPHNLIKRLGLAAGGLYGIAQIVVIDDAGGVVQQLAD